MRRLLIGLLLSALTACESAPIPQTVTGPASEPAYDYAQAAQSGVPLLQFDNTLSQLIILVRRNGPLARFGHDHVIVAPLTQGLIAWPAEPLAARADLRFQVKQWQVDPSAVRARYQLDSTPDAAAIAGTRANMLEKVLQAAHWPEITVGLSHLKRDGDMAAAQAVFTVRGIPHRREVKFRISEKEQVITIRGHIDLRQSDLGLEPLSILGGGLSVADTLAIDYTFQARPVITPATVIPGAPSLPVN